MPPSERQKIYGTDEPPATSQTLTAGSWTVDLENGQLRYLRFGGVEVLRAISFLVRDQFWGTFDAIIDNFAINQSPDCFVVHYDGRCAPNDGDLRFRAEISGDASGRLSFTATGGPRSSFLTNRTGFVVLYPLDGVVGAMVTIDHASGSRDTREIPALVSAHEPIVDIFAITHEAAPGVYVRVEMTGDAYDMEDQRNWTDASLKTYIRPLSKPKPYVMPAGESFEQSITVVVRAARSRKPKTLRGPSIITLGAPLGRIPPVALGVDGCDLKISRAPLPPGVTKLTGRPRAPEEIPMMTEIAERAGAMLSLQFAIPGHDPVAELRSWRAAEGATSVLVTPYRLYPLRPATPEPGAASLESIAHAARSAFPHAAIGGGVMTGFTEFNRNPPPLHAVDFVTHVTSAIVHTADDRSVVDTLDALPHVFNSAKALSSDRPYRIGPGGIGLGLNPDGPPRRADPATNSRATMIRNDPRQRGLFAAAWTLGYAMAVIEHGIDEYAPAHIAGDFGVYNDDNTLRPIYHVVRALAGACGIAVNALSGLPLGCRGFASGGSVWVANLTQGSLSLAFGGGARSVVLDVISFDDAARDPAFFERPPPSTTGVVVLNPFAVAKVTL